VEIKIVNFPETKVAILEHRGSPALEHKSVSRLIAGALKINCRLTNTKATAFITMIQ